MLNEEEQTKISLEITALITEVSVAIAEKPLLKDLSFGLFYQDGSVGFINLDAFAQSLKSRNAEQIQPEVE